MSRGRTPVRTAAAVALAAFLATACGSRLEDDTLQAIDANELGARGGATTDVQGAASDGGAVAGTTGEPATDVGPTPGATTGSVTSGGGSAATGAPLAAGGGTGTATGTGTAGAGGTAGRTPGGSAAPCRPAPGTSRGVTPSEIKAAAIVTDSGPLPGATEGSYRGAASYLAMVNAAGGVCGRKITLLKGDDGLDPSKGRSEFLRLEPQVLGFVGNFSVADSGYIDLIDRTKVPFVSLTVDPSGRRLPSVWPKIADDLIATGPFVWWRQQHPRASKASLLFADVGGVSANVPGTVAAMRKAGFELVQPAVPVRVTDPDYTGQVRNLQDRGVQFVYLFAFEVNMHVRFIRSMRQQNYDPEIKGSNIAFNNRFSQLVGTTGDGWENHLAHLPFLDPGEAGRSPAAARFLEWNNRVFPGGQLDLFPVTGWGRAAFFVEALRRVGSEVTREKLLAELAKLEAYDDGGVGVRIDPRTGRMDRCFAMARHTGGRWVRRHPGSNYECSLGEVLKYK